MRTENRLFGNNLRCFLKDAGISVQQFSEKLGYTEYEAHRILDARTYVSLTEWQKISDCLGKSVEDFKTPLPLSCYEEAGCIECRGEFQDPKNQKLILDIFDLYCDVQEALYQQEA